MVFMIACILYACLATVRFEHYACRGLLMATCVYTHLIRKRNLNFFIVRAARRIISSRGQHI